MEYIPGDFHSPAIRSIPFHVPASGGGGGGGTHRIRFRVVEVVCEDGDLQHVVAEWTHYSGSCSGQPPGVDEYTGYVEIHDSCILSYYTVDFLTEGDGAEGTATYWYERGDEYSSGEECNGMWIVDSICGTPECS
jgi:hypothetical protein